MVFEVISGFNRDIFGVSSIYFGTRNDKHIVKCDNNVTKIRDGWYSLVPWNYHDKDGNVKEAVGIYLIRDGGYLHWPTLICPFKHVKSSTPEGYFSTNLESVRKDIENVFGITKKRFKIHEYGIRYRDIRVVGKILLCAASSTI